jgi:hypothetical protein
MAVRHGLTAALLVAVVACGGQEGEVIAEENFEPPSHRWSVADTAGATYEYADQGYRIVAAEPNQVVYSLLPTDPSFAALSVEADMTLRTGSGGPDTWGVACLSGRRLGYLFTVLADGRYVITKARDLSTAKIDLVKEGKSDVILGPDGTNRVRGDCFGSATGPTRLALFVNGEQMTEAEDAQGLERFDAIGFVVYTRKGGTEVLFDDLLVTEH